MTDELDTWPNDIRTRLARVIGDVYQMGIMHSRNQPHFYSPYKLADKMIAIVRDHDAQRLASAKAIRADDL